LSAFFALFGERFISMLALGANPDMTKENINKSAGLAKQISNCANQWW
jgi:hypothetical protein